MRKAPTVQEAWKWIGDNENRTDLSEAEQKQLIDYNNYVNFHAPKGTPAYNQLRGQDTPTEALEKRRQPPQEEEPGQNSNTTAKPPYTKPASIHKEQVTGMKALVNAVAPFAHQLNKEHAAHFGAAVRAIQAHDPSFKPSPIAQAQRAPKPGNFQPVLSPAQKALVQIVQWGKAGVPMAREAEEQAAKVKVTKPLLPPSLQERAKGEER